MFESNYLYIGLKLLIDVRDGGGQFALTALRSRKITIVAINGSAAGVGITQTLPMDIVSGNICILQFIR